MKTGATSILKSSSFKLLHLWVLFLAALAGAYAQDTEVETDSTETGFSIGRIELQDPESIVTRYTYDPQLDRYIYTQQVGEYDISYPVILTPEQYLELVEQENMKSYFKEKIDAFSGRKAGSEEARKNLLPNFYVNNNFFESVFGGNTIEVIPQGSVA
ncbi:MAG: hypothetical protein HKN61_09955, partial [Flavobacteriaceae bacterium]|nr:hypothetical protein [Flavobacteriaceae bacterium]